MSREEKIQEKIITILEENDIYAYNVILTFEYGNEGLLSITVYTEEDMRLLSEFLGYKSMCDKSGYTWIEETNTILLEGLALTNLFL